MTRLTPTRLDLVLSAAALLLAAANTPALATWPHDPNIGNVPVCSAANDQAYPVSTSDGAGGTIITWPDFRSGTNQDIYAQRLNAAGVPQWTANGVGLCTAPNGQNVPSIVSDGAGGAIVTWYDFRSGTNNDIYAQRVNAAGVPQWTANGVALCTAANDQLYPAIASDGAGGAIITWEDSRSGNYDIYAQRVNAAGVPQWAANGVVLCNAANDQQVPTFASDGAGGAIATWMDLRGGAGNDIYAQRVNAAGAPQWTANGVALCTAANFQYGPTIVSDGAGGGIVTWYDFRSGTNEDIYAQRVSAVGLTQWFANGVGVCTAAGDQLAPTITSDGAGGAIVAWHDTRAGNYDIYAQRLSPAGASQWGADGLPLCTATNDQYYPAIASDGTGGAIAVWYDFRSGVSYDIYAQRVSGPGVLQWAYNGVALSTAASAQASPTVVADGAGGAIAAWYDLRSGTNYDIYAQRVERYGQLGNPEPVIASVRDVPFDQGGFVKVGWSASYLDVDPTAGIYEYRVWRSAPPNVATQAARARAVTEDPDEAARTSRLLRLQDSATNYLWELVGRQQAFELSGYSMVTATTSDSVGAGNPRTAFIVEAGTSAYTSSPHWFSAPDSGYSVDNLPPSPPAPFSAAYAGGATHLHWGANHEADLAGYRLYRGSSSGFVPGPGNLVSAQPDTGFGDPGPAGSWYKLSAVDSHGNESLFAILGPGSTTDAPGGPAAYSLSFARPAPDPVLGRSTALRFGLPRDEWASLAVLDATGRLVRTLVSGTQIAGEHVIEWDLRSDAGRPVPAGLYFLRLSAEGRTLTQRMVALR